MKIFEKTRIELDDKSTYILLNMGKNFLINKFGNTTKNPYDQFLLINKNLETIALSNIYEKEISIYSVFTCKDGNRFLLYCNDPDLLIYSNLENGIIYPIDISSLIKDCISPIVHWNTNTVILSTYNGIFYELNIIDKKIISLTSALMSKNYKDFYNFWLKTKQHNAITLANFENRSFIYHEEGLLVFADYKNNIEVEVEELQNGYHDVIFHKGYFIFVAKKSLTIKNNEEMYTYHMTDDLYIFARVAVIDDSEKLSFIALECYQGGKEKKDRLIRYELS